jgi:Zn-dependent protease with chaperone function
MRISLPPPAPKKLQRLEAAAAARPGLYRTRLALIALTGDVILTFVRVVPFALPIAIGALFFSHPYYYALAAVTIVFLIWVMRPGYRDGGKSIERKDAPDLYAALDDLKTKLDVGGRMEVRLDDEINAGAREARGLLGLVGTRRVLTLGAPLLALLGKHEIRAVIAHEFGHFSRRHGRLGHWLYWAHLGWLSHAEEIDDESSILERAGATISEIFVPAFSRRAMVWSRRCEYEADADAAGAVGGEHLVSGLARLGLFGAWHAEELPRLVHRWQCAEPTAPNNFLERMIAAFEATPPDILSRIEAGEASRSRDWLDTHPRLAERAAALGMQPKFAPRAGPAGSALLGGLWPTVAAEYNTRWRKQHAVAWSVVHAHYRLIEAPLLAAEPEAVAGWPMAQRLEHARALRKLDPARGLTELAALRSAAPYYRDTTFAYAAARLTEGDASAVETLRALAREDATWRVPAYGVLVRYHDRIGDRVGADNWAGALERAGAVTMFSYASVCDGLEVGELSPTTRPAPLIEILRAGLAADPLVAKAWLVETKAPLIAPGQANILTLRADALILFVDPLDDMQQPYDVAIVRARHQRVLGELIEPNALPVVISFYSTEPLQESLRNALERLPAASAYVRGDQRKN